MIKGSKMTSEQRKRVSEAQKKRFATSPSWMKGKHPSEESRRRMSEAQKRRMLNPEERKKLSEANKGQIPWMKGKKHTTEDLLKMGLAHKGLHPKTEFKKGYIPWIKGKNQSEEARRKMSIAKKGKRASPKTEFKKGLDPWNKGKTEVYSKETKKEMRESWRKTFLSSPETRMKMKLHRATQIFPVKDTMPEKKIQSFLKQMEIKFLAHQYIKIEHAYQCDILIPSMNLVIEIDGDYWHGNPKFYSDNRLTERIIKGREIDKLRIRELIEKGFKVLRLWESDIKKMNLEDFMEKIRQI